ncbi:hypothetical protein lerEdw1_014977 [Lerista edwardsae]|nr:hypothetical protein lerEdw1_014977 [Lerista edwardsae]
MAASSAARTVGSSLGKHLKEIRIHLCQRSPASQGARDFIEQHYVTLKKANPDFPILIRECSDVQPKLWARYGQTACLPVYQFDQSVSTFLQMEKVQETLRIFEEYLTLPPPPAFGREKSVPLSNLTSDQVAKALETIATSRI